MIGHGCKFSRKKEAAIAAIISERTLGEAAHVTGVSTKTLQRWQKIPEFQDQLRETRRELNRQNMLRMQQSSPAAVVTILKVMTDNAVPPAVKLKAANLVLAYAHHGVQQEDIEVRLRELERTAEDAKKRGDK